MGNLLDAKIRSAVSLAVRKNDWPTIVDQDEQEEGDTLAATSADSLEMGSARVKVFFFRVGGTELQNDSLLRFSRKLSFTRKGFVISVQKSMS